MFDLLQEKSWVGVRTMGPWRLQGVLSCRGLMEEGATDLGFEGHWKHAFFTVVSCSSHTYCKTIDPRSTWDTNILRKEARALEESKGRCTHLKKGLMECIWDVEVAPASCDNTWRKTREGSVKWEKVGFNPQKGMQFELRGPVGLFLKSKNPECSSNDTP